jgi:hypothetical protein
MHDLQKILGNNPYSLMLQFAEYKCWMLDKIQSARLWIWGNHLKECREIQIVKFNLKSKKKK